MTRADLRTAVLSTADDWRADPTSWLAGTDPLRVLVTLRESGEMLGDAGLPVYLAIARYVDGDWSREQLVEALGELIPDGELSQQG